MVYPREGPLRSGEFEEKQSQGQLEGQSGGDGPPREVAAALADRPSEADEESNPDERLEGCQYDQVNLLEHEPRMRG